MYLSYCTMNKFKHFAVNNAKHALPWLENEFHCLRLPRTALTRYLGLYDRGELRRSLATKPRVLLIWTRSFNARADVAEASTRRIQ